MKTLIRMAYHPSQKRTFQDQLVLVDLHDQTLQPVPKLKAHQSTFLQERQLPHRAFSLFLFNEANQLLLQQRSKLKILFPTQWTNSCCSHPLWGNDIQEEVKRRCKFELNLDIFGLKPIQAGRILYKAVQEELGEFELDYLFFLKADFKDQVEPNLEEVSDSRWIEMDKLARFEEEIKGKGLRYTPWFKLIWQNSHLTRLFQKIILKGQTTLDQGIIDLC